MHFVANHELHTTDPGLSLKALALLQREAAMHPHTQFLPGDEGEAAARRRAGVQRGTGARAESTLLP